MNEILNMYADNIGYVKMLEYMGDDFTPAEDARTSTNKGRLGDNKDAKLQERLMRDRHTSPFEAITVKFEVCVPLFVVRELDRHRTLDKNAEDDPFELISPEESFRKWTSRNEMSGRYVKLPNVYYHPLEVRAQSLTNKQGGDEGQHTSFLVSPDIANEFLMRGSKLTAAARELYEWAIDNDIEKGLARIYNTQNQYTKIRYTANMKNWLDALHLRLKRDVLYECRVVANCIKKLLEKRFPTIMSSWQKLVCDAFTISRCELDALLSILEDRKGDKILNDLMIRVKEHLR